LIWQNVRMSSLSGCSYCPTVYAA
jgi:hypothetical protein